MSGKIASSRRRVDIDLETQTTIDLYIHKGETLSAFFVRILEHYVESNKSEKNVTQLSDLGQISLTLTQVREKMEGLRRLQKMVLISLAKDNPELKQILTLLEKTDQKNIHE